MVMNFLGSSALFSALLGDRRIVIKIDVESHEAHVIHALSGLLKGSNVDGLIIEIDEQNLNKHGSTAAEIYDALGAAEFRARRGLGAAPRYNDVFVRTGQSQQAEETTPPSPTGIAAQ